MLLTGAFFLLLGVPLGFWINARQLALATVAVAVLVFLVAIAVDEDATRGIVLAVVAFVFLQLGYVIAILVQAALVARGRRAGRGSRQHR